MNKSSHDPENGDLIPFDTAGERLLGDIRVVIKSVRARVAQTTDTMLVTLYWNIGWRIKSDIPGNERAPYGKEIVYALSRQLTVEYGKQIVQTLSGQLTVEYGRGFSSRNLWMIRKFYLTYKNLNVLRAELSWTHYCILIQIDDSGRPVILSRIREPQIHSPPEELSACYAQGRAGNADECRFISLVSSFINFHPQLIDLNISKKYVGGWLFDE